MGHLHDGLLTGEVPWEKPEAERSNLDGVAHDVHAVVPLGSAEDHMFLAGSRVPDKAKVFEFKVNFSVTVCERPVFPSTQQALTS